MTKMPLAEECYQECREKRVHYQDVPRYLERKLMTEEEDVQEAVEIYVRYNLFDRRLGDRDIDYAKELLLNAK